MIIMKSKFFTVGTVVSTRRVHDLMESEAAFALEVLVALDKYCNKDWGKLCKGDCALNDEALKYPEDLYLLGVYKTSRGDIDIITNRASEVAGDNVTTICFPDER